MGPSPPPGDKDDCPRSREESSTPAERTGDEGEVAERVTGNDAELLPDELVFEPAVAATRERLKRTVDLPPLQGACLDVKTCQRTPLTDLSRHFEGHILKRNSLAVSPGIRVTEFSLLLWET